MKHPERTDGIPADGANLPELISMLMDKDIRVRDRACQALIHLGKPAVIPLIDAIQDSNGRLRCEAARALSKMQDPETGSALVKALEDVRLDVRWLAADGLIALGYEGAVALLQGLMEESWNDRNLRESAHHVLRELSRYEWSQPLMPVMDALEGTSPAVSVPPAAHDALNALREQRG